MDVANFLSAAKNFFREDIGEVVGAYFDGETIFLVRLTDTVETCEIASDGDDFAHVAEKISVVCRQRNWQTQSVGLCLREVDAVTYQTELANVPEKDFPAMVESWSRAQSGKDAANSFARVGSQLWMETIPRATADEICAAFRNVGLNLTALSVMPPDLLTKKNPLDRAKFIADVAANKTSPNLLRTRHTSFNAKKFSAAIAAIFLLAALVTAAGTLADWFAASNELDAAKLAVNEMRDDLSLKKFFDEDIDALRRLNNLTVNVSAPKTFNALINLGKVAGGDVRLTAASVDENSAHVDGLATNADAVKSCLARVKSFVNQRARLENSSARDDGEITFAIRADFIND